MDAAASPSNTRKIFLYFGPLTLLLYLVTPDYPLLDIPLSYILKNQLHATAIQVSTFRVLVAIPLYMAFVFGLTRDEWNPFGLRDRGFFLLFAPLATGVYVSMALGRTSYPRLLVGMILVVLSFQFIMAAYQGLIALIGQEKLMSGRLSTLWNIFSLLPAVAASFASGFISERLSASQTFFLAAALTLLIGAFGLLKPRAVFSHAYEKPQAARRAFVSDLKRLAKHRVLYPAVLINILWNFAPGVRTPLQFYLTGRLHASDAVYAYFLGICLASSMPTFLVYGHLCTRVPLNRLLWWATIVGVPSSIPLAFINSGYDALLIAIPIGLMSGLGLAAYYDLAIRSCPPGLQGTLTGCGKSKSRGLAL